MSREPQLFRINSSAPESEALLEVDFAQLGFQERRDIQELVAANPGILGEELLIIAKEFSSFDKTNERLDLLAVDANGKLVVIELKRDDSGADAYWQAIKYASYFRRASKQALVDMLANHEELEVADAEARLLKHLDADDLDSLNTGQRIILASHRFAPEVTSAALWLNEKVPGESLITCVQLTPYRDEKTTSLYLQSTTIIPVPGEEDYAVQIGNRQLQRSSGSFAERLQGTYDRNRSDDVTRFLRSAADLAFSALPEQVRPDKRSRWAGGWAGGAYDHRYYRAWYSRAPWSNWGMSYSMNLYRLDNGPVPWKVNVEFGYFSGELREKVAALDVHKDQNWEEDRVFVTHTSEALDEEFANTLTGSLGRFIKVITPIVDKHEEERNQEEA